MDLEIIKSKVYVSATSKTGLRWLEEIRGGQHGQFLVAEKDSVAGSWSKIGEGVGTGKGYWEVGISGKSYWAHRIVYALTHGPVEKGLKVDHKDGDGENNSIDNLRLVTHKTNLQNIKMSKINTSGVTGVCLTCDGFWKASWNVEGVSVSKKFGVNKFGNDTAFQLACDYRKRKIAELNNNGEAYSERHGT